MSFSITMFSTLLAGLLLTLLLSGCITSNTIQKAKLDRQPQKIRSVRNAYIAADHSLIVNFNGRLSGKERNVPLHMRVPVDALLSLYDKGPALQYSPSKTEREAYGITRIDRAGQYGDSLVCGTVLSLEREVLQKGYYTDTSLMALPGKLILPGSKHDFKYRYHYEDLNAQHIVLLYIPEKPIPHKYRTDYVVLNIEPSAQKRYSRYGFIPFTSIADAATAPFQAIGYAGLALMAYYMKF